MAGIGKPVKAPPCFWRAAVIDPDSLGVTAKVASEWLVLWLLVGRCSISVRLSWPAALASCLWSLSPHYVDGRNHVPGIRLAHPVGHGRRVCAQFSQHGQR